MSSDLKHGEHFLIDYYAFFGVAQDAEADTIKQVYREKQKLYHPDRYEGLAPEFKDQASHMSHVAAEGYETLSDPERRRAYDEQLANWEGPISEHGNPVVDMSKPYFSVSGLLSGELGDPEAVAHNHKLVKSFANFDEGTFRLIEAQYNATDTPSPSLEVAYRKQLENRDLYLNLTEETEWKMLGSHNRNIVAPPRAYLAHVEAEIATSRERVVGEVDRHLFLISTGEQKLLNTTGEAIAAAIATDPSQAFAHYRGVALERFEKAAERIRALAKERDAVVEERYLLIESEYRPLQEKRFPRVIVCAEVGEVRRCAVFRLYEGNRVAEDDEVAPEDLGDVTDADEALRWIERGYNVLFFRLSEDLLLKDELEEVVMRHFDEVF